MTTTAATGLKTTPKPKKKRIPAKPFSKENQPEGRGRPPGSKTKISVKTIMAAIEDTTGKPFEQQLAENYYKAILEEDGKLVATYDGLFLSKLVADKVDVNITEGAEALENKQQAFMAALQAYQHGVLNPIPLDAITVDPTVTMTVEPTVAHSNTNGDSPWGNPDK